jgi:hypothetical protein
MQVAVDLMCYIIHVCDPMNSIKPTEELIDRAQGI